MGVRDAPLRMLPELCSSTKLSSLGAPIPKTLSPKVATIFPPSGNECKSQCLLPSWGLYSLLLLAYFVIAVFMGTPLTNSSLEYFTWWWLFVFLLLFMMGMTSSLHVALK